MKGASHIAPLGLRLPEELKEKIQERAKKNGRSTNAEIVQILEDSLQEREQTPDLEVLLIEKQAQEIVSEMQKRLIDSLQKSVDAGDRLIRAYQDQNELIRRFVLMKLGVDIQELMEKESSKASGQLEPKD